MLSKTTSLLPEGLFASLGVTRGVESGMCGVELMCSLYLDDSRHLTFISQGPFILFTQSRHNPRRRPSPFVLAVTCRVIGISEGLELSNLFIFEIFRKHILSWLECYCLELSFKLVKQREVLLTEGNIQIQAKQPWLNKARGI